MGEGDREMLKLKITMKKPKDRTAFDITFLSNYVQLSKIVTMRSKVHNGERVFNSQSPGHPVVDMKNLVNLDQQGTRLEERTRK
eukprot:10129805-Heterocapsa_arctica.AAC.1